MENTSRRAFHILKMETSPHEIRYKPTTLKIRYSFQRQVLALPLHFINTNPSMRRVLVITTIGQSFQFRSIAIHFTKRKQKQRQSILTFKVWKKNIRINLQMHWPTSMWKMVKRAAYSSKTFRNHHVKVSKCSKQLDTIIRMRVLLAFIGSFFSLFSRVICNEMERKNHRLI